MEEKDKMFASVLVIIIAVIIGLFVYFSSKIEKVVPEVTVAQTDTKKEEMRIDFVGGCTENGTATYSYCNCVFEDLYKELGAERLQREALEYALNEKFSKNMLDLAINSSLKCTK